MYYQSVMEPEAMAVLQRTTQILRQLVRVNVGVKLTHRHILGLKHTTAIHHTVPFSSIVLAITHYSRLSRGDFEAILALSKFLMSFTVSPPPNNAREATILTSAERTRSTL